MKSEMKEVFDKIIQTLENFGTCNINVIANKTGSNWKTILLYLEVLEKFRVVESITKTSRGKLYRINPYWELIFSKKSKIKLFIEDTEN